MVSPAPLVIVQSMHLDRQGIEVVAQSSSGPFASVQLRSNDPQLLPEYFGLSDRFAGGQIEGSLDLFQSRGQSLLASFFICQCS